MKNIESVHSSNHQMSERKINDILSPKFNNEFISVEQRRDLVIYSANSPKLDNSSHKNSEFTFNNCKDNSICNINMNVIEALNSSRVIYKVNKIYNPSSYPNNIILDHEIKLHKKLILSVLII